MHKLVGTIQSQKGVTRMLVRLAPFNTPEELCFDSLTELIVRVGTGIVIVSFPQGIGQFLSSLVQMDDFRPGFTFQGSDFTQVPGMVLLFQIVGQPQSVVVSDMHTEIFEQLGVTSSGFTQFVEVILFTLQLIVVTLQLVNKSVGGNLGFPGFPVNFRDFTGSGFLVIEVQNGFQLGNSGLSVNIVGALGKRINPCGVSIGSG
mmetsp:Transcript_31701/g.36035  ORF Transcript_31701/g.36035 Transcript_31701/m.36035 type:complete len:203 (-) Transcript_31701:97-705(-)